MFALASSILLSSALGSAFEPIASEIRRRLNQIIKNEIPSPQELIELRYKQMISQSEFIEMMNKHGIANDIAEKMFQASQSYLSIADIISLHRRNVIDDNTYKNMLIERGVTDERRIFFEKATEFIPSVSDVIRFAVREAFTQTTVEKFQLDADLPEEYIEYAKRLGLKEEDAKLYWRAHWELPSVSMGLEMFHRGIITRDELELLLKSLDVMPFWREKILQLSYNLPTRVDLRRMYRIGVVDATYVFETYRKMGYDEETAKALTQFTVVSEVEDEKQISKSDIINAYKDHTISREEAKSSLRAIGYSENATELILLIADNDIMKEKIKNDIEVIESKYVNGEVDEDTMFDMLSQLNLTAARVTKEFNRIINVKKKQVRKLDKDEYIKMTKMNIMTVEELRNELKSAGYTMQDIQRLLRLHGITGGDESEY